ncbi:glutamine amidotransferase [Thalassovita sp.]|jgi:GMP synthase (glutamine-hydrolysing)|uniref:glutamine amidotransferase n=1 Tax=Thalassovita sp. TaxID=1979401 RepID=UPI003B5CC9C4
MKPFLILQLRPETEASDDEYAAFLAKGGLTAEQTHRIRLEQEDMPELDLSDYSGVIVGGGPGCVSDPIDKKDPLEAKIEAEILSLMPQITENDIPFMGCCYGIGILGHHLGASVSKEQYGEPVGPTNCKITAADPMLDGVPDEFLAFVGHKEALQYLPDGAVHLLASDPCPFQMIRYKQNVYATQFHPEADSAGFELRIRLYKNKGYFHPDEADSLIAMCRAADVHAPERILRNFVKRYGR